MKRKPFWKRCNRGFIVSIGLLAAVLIYVLVTQLMQISDRREIRKLSDEYRGYMESTALLTDEQIASYRDKQAAEAEKSRLKSELTPFFDGDAKYLDEAVTYFTDNIQNQVQGIERIKTHSDAKLIDSSFVIDQDVATFDSTYVYTVSGEFLQNSTGALAEESNVQERLQLTVLCKKEKGKWKLFRIGHANWVKADQSASGGE